MAQSQFALILFIASACCIVVESKVFERCELAKLLHLNYHLHLAEVAQWVCIAQHSSGLNTATEARSATGGSHGLFQISDVYWCSPPGQGSGCNLPCLKLKDDDLSDDLFCAKRIFDEHQRISGDGYTAWNAYQQFCKQNSMSYIQNCFPGKHNDLAHLRGYNSENGVQDYSLKKPGRVYKRCELARELYDKHRMPMQQIPTWVCIAEHESHLNTAAVGRLNGDGSADHGIFQISDLYWCSQDHFNSGDGKACGLACSKLLDNDITDDVHCVQKIFNEHAVLSGDGFTAWTVYKPYCQSQGYENIANCFQSFPQQQNKINTFGSEMASDQVLTTTKYNLYNKNPFFKNILRKGHNKAPSNNEIFESTPYVTTVNDISVKAKIYTRCSLAQELFFTHNFPPQDISTWVCIAEHESQLNTAAVGRLNTDGSLDHGLFQINDRYWCDHTKHGGKGCNLPCRKLLDNDISDDVACIKTIFEEHSRLSGDGFNAWTVYKSYCRNQTFEQLKMCFEEKTLFNIESLHFSSTSDVKITQDIGKIYNKCTLAQELHHKHRMPMSQIPKWVCIAQHESSYHTAAIGRLNTDGSADHGLFQISDLYWCSHNQNDAKACNIPCEKLIDSDITDDVNCIRTIYEEHNKISGDGFNAWTVYKPYCGAIKMNHIKECFTESEISQALLSDVSSSMHVPEQPYQTAKKTAAKGKVFKKCELAEELLIKHGLPLEQVIPWVCIAQHVSSFNTAAIGRSNADGSLDHGLFQISDLYWCSHEHNGGKGCSIPCEKLLDSDISDDIQCIKVIYEEHTRISGNGFSAWPVYKSYCHDRQLEEIRKCFSSNQIEKFIEQPIFLNTYKHIAQPVPYFGKVAYGHNPFLNNLKSSTHNEVTNYSNNPFLQNILIGSNSEKQESITDTKFNIDIKKQQNYQNNPFLSKYSKQTASTQNYLQSALFKPESNYKNNPFLNGEFSSNTINNLTTKPNTKPSRINQFKSNPFLSHIKLLSNDLLMPFTFENKSFSPTASNDKIEVHKNYVNAHDFRTTTPNSTTRKELLEPLNIAVTSTQKYMEPTTLKPNMQIITSLSYINSNDFRTTTTTPKPKTTPSSPPTTIGTTTQKFLNPTTEISTTGKYNIQTSTKATTSGWLNKNPSTKAQEVSTTFYATTTTESPKTSTTKQEQRKDSTTTIKPSTVVITKPILNLSMIESTTLKYHSSTKKFKTTTENWSKWDKSTTTKSNTTQQKSSTTKPTTRTENWRKWDKTTNTESNITQQKSSGTKPTTTTEDWRTTTKSNITRQKSSTTKPTTTRENWRKWDKTTATESNTTQQKSSTTKPTTTTENWRKWDKTTTTESNITQQKSSRTKLTTTTEDWRTTTKSNITRQKSSTTKPTTTTRENWRKWDKTTTTESNITQPKSSAIKPSTTAENWRIWDSTTTTKSNIIQEKSSTAKSTENLRKSNKTTDSYFNTTTSKPITITENWRKLDRTATNNNKPTTTKPLTTTENWRKWDKTSTKKSSPVRPQTTTENSIKSDKTTNSQYKSTTTKPLTTIENWRKWDTSTTKAFNLAEQKSTTTKPPTKNLDKSKTTKPQSSLVNSRKWNKTINKDQNTTSSHKEEIQQQSMTRPPSQTSKDNWKKWEKPTTKQTHLTATENQVRTTSNSKNIKQTTTTKSQTYTENRRNRTTTKKPSTTNTSLQQTKTNLKNKQNSTTSKPSTLTEDWRKWDRTTTKEPKPTIKNPERTTRNWRNVKEFSTQKPLTSTENWRKWDSTTNGKSIKDERAILKAGKNRST